MRCVAALFPDDEGCDAAFPVPPCRISAGNDLEDALRNGAEALSPRVGGDD